MEAGAEMTGLSGWVGGCRQRDAVQEGRKMLPVPLQGVNSVNLGAIVNGE